MIGEQLLTLHGVAHHLQVSDKTVVRLAAEDPDFPKAITVRGQKRWVPEEIRDWERLQQLKARLPVPPGGTNPDTNGQIGTSAPPAGFSPSRPRDRK